MTDLRKAAEMAYNALSRDPADPIFVGETIDALRAALAQPEQDLQLVANFLKEYGLEVLEVIAALKTQPEQTAMEPDIAKVLFDNVESLYVEDAQPEQEPAKKPCRSPYCECAVGACTHPGFYDARGSQPEQEPVAWIFAPNNELLWPSEVEATNPIEVDSYRPLYTHPPKRKPLTDEEMDEIWFNSKSFESIVRAVEKAHGIGVEE
jgi:hypothetical protein